MENEKQFDSKLSIVTRIRWFLLADHPAHISVDELVLNMRTADMEDECDECSLEMLSRFGEILRWKEKLSFPSRHFRGSFAYLSHF